MYNCIASGVYAKIRGAGKKFTKKSTARGPRTQAPPLKTGRDPATVGMQLICGHTFGIIGIALWSEYNSAIIGR